MTTNKPQIKQYKTITQGEKKLDLKFLIYVLKLKNDRIYVGRTTQEGYEKRLELHKKGKASAWTRKYRFVSEMKDLYIQNASPFDQDKRVKQLMYLYGPNMVRGGTYSKTQSLTPEQEQFILKQMRGANDQCLYCGDTGHFIKDCKKHKEHLERKKTIPASTNANYHQQNELQQFSDSDWISLSDQSQQSQLSQQKIIYVQKRNPYNNNYNNYSNYNRSYDRTPRKNYNTYNSQQRFGQNQCFYCKRNGHWEEQCWKKKNDLRNRNGQLFLLLIV